MTNLLPSSGSHEDTDAVGDQENAIELKDVAGLSQGQIVWRRFIHHKGAIVGIIVLVVIAIVAFTSVGVGPIPGWWKWNFTNTQPVQNAGHPTIGLPTWLGGSGLAWGDFPFGQDNIGRDNFARVMRGIQTSLMVMFVMGIIALVVGVVIGGLAGFYRKKTDNLLMRFTDMIITLPVIVIGAILGRLVGGGTPLLLAVALGLILWPGLARLVRGEFLSLREREFVDAARVAGASDFRIMAKHMLPNAIGVIIVNTTLLMSAAIVLETALSFLGFGINAPDVSLGQLINEYQSAFATRPWLFWWPGLFIIVIALCINFIGDGLRDAFDPRQKKIPSQKQMDKAEASARQAAGRTMTGKGGI
ncbi:ABC transporter permease [Saxibacter everestensis]|uniref:ABC transporter permease n=1 Tax=Saxibacter everestensis TaxID=2909229 RepID=A0ABY8QNN9_9MICO|nr:ABC transporter permease [Brevibacteriaceae bacterium ZFBP1038]